MRFSLEIWGIGGGGGGRSTDTICNIFPLTRDGLLGGHIKLVPRNGAVAIFQLIKCDFLLISQEKAKF